MLAFFAVLWYNFFMKKIHEINKNNTETVTISRAEYESMKTQIDWLTQQLTLAKNKQFGSSSEKANEELCNQLSFFFNEAEAYLKSEEPVETEVSSHKRRKNSGNVKDILPDNIQTEVIRHEIPEEERVCPECGDIMQEIGKEVRRTLKIIPAQAVLLEEWFYTYACKRCNDENIKTPVSKAAKTPAVIPGSFASPEAIAHIMTQKFIMGSPLYRQELELKNNGIQLSRQTMSNWILTAADKWLRPVYDELHKKLLNEDILHADETTLQVLKEPDKKAETKSYMWLYRTGMYAESPIVLYEYQPSRSREHPIKFLNGFTGYLHTDGYSGYHNLPDSITVVGCWAHARRKFDEAVNAVPKAKRTPNSAAVTGLAYCTRLFTIEKQIASLSPEERYIKRQELEKPILDALFAWVNTREAAPKSALGQAMTYLKNQQPYLENYMKDGRLELSNNRAERSIKPFVIDRKNFLFANTPNGAQGSAIIFSLIETAKEAGLNPYKYLVYLLKTAPQLSLENADWAEKILPQYAPDSCKAN